MISMDVAKPNTADAIGRIVIHDYMNSTNDQDVKSTVVVMDQVLCQDDVQYLTLLDKMKNENLLSDDADYIRGKCLDQMSPEQKLSFQNAIH